MYLILAQQPTQIIIETWMLGWLGFGLVFVWGVVLYFFKAEIYKHITTNNESLSLRGSSERKLIYEKIGSLTERHSELSRDLAIINMMQRASSDQIEKIETVIEKMGDQLGKININMTEQSTILRGVLNALKKHND